MMQSSVPGGARPWPFSEAVGNLRQLLELAASEGPQTVILDERQFLITAQPKATQTDIDFLISGGPLDDDPMKSP